MINLRSFHIILLLILWFSVNSFANDNLAQNPCYSLFETPKTISISKNIFKFVRQIIGSNFKDIKQSNLSLQVIKQIYSYHPITAEHSIRVANMALSLAQALGLSVEEQNKIFVAGLLHDLGKIYIPVSVLNYPGTLTDEMKTQMHQHPKLGFENLREVLNDYQDILDGILFHHENLNGLGYPFGLNDSQLSLYPRILHIVDVFDALLNPRSYKTSLNLENVLNIMDLMVANYEIDSEIYMIFKISIWNFSQSRTTNHQTNPSPSTKQ